MCALTKLNFSFLQKKIAFWCSFKCVPNWCLVCLLEHEKDRHLPFLDSNFSRRFQGNLETSVYCKPTHMGKYHAFDSHHPIFYKKSVAKTFLRRADCLPSSLDLKAEERKYVSNVLKANGYTKLIPSQGSPIMSWIIVSRGETNYAWIKTLKTGF